METDPLSPDAILPSWLAVEAALAQASAQVGILPEEHAGRIAACCRVELLDRAAITADAGKTGHRLVPVIRELGRVVGGEAAAWVHYGATTQNILQTGLVLRLKAAHVHITAQYRALLADWAVLARRHRTTVLAGRTHGQQAAPITFGFKVAGWIDEGARHLERMETAAEGAFQAMLGGAVGNFASFGAIGPELQRVFAQKLELGVMLHPSRSVFDALAAYGLALSLAAGTLARSARDQYEMMKSEIGELFPDDGSIGSSTMPQKRNPATNTRSLRCWSRIRSRVPLLLESLAGEYEAQPPNDDLLAEALTDIARDLRSLIDLQRSSMATLVVDERRMLRNIQDAGGWILAESLMFTLAGELGRMRAHDLLHELALDARRKGLAIQDAVAEHPGLQEILKGRPVAELFDPARHVGLCPQLVDEALARACL